MDNIRMRPSHWLIVGAVSLVTFSLWAWFNQPLEEPLWPDRIMGFAFSPYRADQDPQKDIHPSREQIEQDLALLAGKTYAVRTYTVKGVLAEVPKLAKKFGINVTVGGWIGSNEEENNQELERLIQTVNANKKNVVRVMVGNETLLHNQTSITKLLNYIDQVRAKVDAPVSTAEPWHIWLKYPELVKQCDFITVHMLPYWEGIAREKAVDYIVSRMQELQAAYPDKPIIIGEVGWPSDGRTRIHAKTGLKEQATFLRRFLAQAIKEKYVYYVIEAFDQPWKNDSLERGVGPYWGVYNADRNPKFPFQAPIVGIPQWYVLAGASLIVGLLSITFLFLDSHTLKHRGRFFLAILAYAVASLAVYVVYDYSQQYLTRGAVLFGFLMGIGMIGVFLVLFAEAHEWAEAAWIRTGRRKMFSEGMDEDKLPWVSIHVPAYNEPPDMMIHTLNALAALDYPNFEVLVIDNNTKNPAIWEPVRDHCAILGERFRFFHIDPLGGFKAGALNYALSQTSPRTEIVAVIDSDYVVDSDWLRHLAPLFQKPEIAIVQSPQDYSDRKESIFKSMCYAEYSGFFHIGMITRNERNAIIQHGTMTLVRRHVLDEVGGWAEWCITEDAELGLRIFERGYQAYYLPHSYGRGLMPDTFIDYKKQRLRWAYGAVRILRAHWQELTGLRSTALTWGQRYHFLAGWMPWMGDGLNLVFNIIALYWSAAMMLAPRYIDSPAMVFSVLPMILFGFKLLKHVHLYYTNVGISPTHSLAAAFAGLSLTHTISLAIMQGFFGEDKPFFRTPKQAIGHRFWQALSTVREEALFMVAFWGFAWGIQVYVGFDFLDTRVWVAVLLIQSIPYTISVLMAIISGLPTSPLSIPLVKVPFMSYMLAKKYLFNRYIFFLALFYLYAWFANPLIELTKGTLRMEVPFLLYLYYCLNMLSKESKWQAVIAALPLALLYLIHDYFFLIFFRVPKLNDLDQIPELLRVIDMKGTLAVAVGLLLFVIVLARQFRPSIKGGMVSIPALFILIFPFVYPSGFIQLYTQLSIGVIHYSSGINVEYNGRIVTALYNQAKHIEILKNISQYRDINKLSLKLPAEMEKEGNNNGRNVHVILLEGFLDPTLMTKLPVPVNPVHPDYSHFMGKQQGFSISPVVGGYTAQAEFEILCGVPAFQEFDVIEFNTFTGAPTYCLPAILKRLGYKVVGAHGFKPDFFNTVVAYRSIGFEKTYFAKEYTPNEDTYLSKGEEPDNKYFADALLFEQNLAFIKRSMEEKKPLFNFLLTVYGHTPFEYGNRVGPPMFALPELPWDLERIINQHYYRTRDVAHYLQKLIALDPTSLIIVVSDHLPPLEGGVNRYNTFGYLTTDIPDRYYRNRFFVFRDGKAETYETFYHFNIYRLILDYVTNQQYCKNKACDFSYPIDKEKFRNDYRIIVGLASQK